MEYDAIETRVQKVDLELIKIEEKIKGSAWAFEESASSSMIKCP